MELSKLDTYFSDDPELQEFRWKIESHKLDHTFPYLIAVGNLLSLLSLFESYLVLLAGELLEHTSLQLQAVKGQGVSRLFTFFRSLGISTESISLYEQVQAAIKIRNCLTHASGMLEWSRENEDLRRIQAKGTYLSQKHRKMRKDDGREFDEVLINSSALGDRLIVNNQYCHVLCSYLSTYFSELCAAVKVALQTKSSK